jgi:predicted transcriptional regulator
MTTNQSSRNLHNKSFIMGRLILKNISSLTEAVKTFGYIFDYRAQKNWTEIPLSLRLKLGKLASCKVIDPEPNWIFEPPEEFINNLAKSSEIMHFSSYFQPVFSGLHPSLLEKNKSVTFVIAKNISEKVFSLFSKKQRGSQLTENLDFYVYNGNSSIVSLTVTERFMALLLRDKKGKLDYRLLMSSESNAIEWGKELFDYYKDLSKKNSGKYYY